MIFTQTKKKKRTSKSHITLSPRFTPQQGTKNDVKIYRKQKRKRGASVYSFFFFLSHPIYINILINSVELIIGVHSSICPLDWIIRSAAFVL